MYVSPSQASCQLPVLFDFEWEEDVRFYCKVLSEIQVLKASVSDLIRH
jgi:hypothetical protein